MFEKKGKLTAPKYIIEDYYPAKREARKI